MNPQLISSLDNCEYQLQLLINRIRKNSDDFRACIDDDNLLRYYLEGNDKVLELAKRLQSELYQMREEQMLAP